MVQIGTAFGIAITTIVHDHSLRKDHTGLSLPSEETLRSYKNAQWTAFGIALFGECHFFNPLFEVCGNLHISINLKLQFCLHCF